jgi:hypothetical protein
MGVTLSSLCEWNNVSKTKHITYKSYEKWLIMKGCGKEFTSHLGL